MTTTCQRASINLSCFILFYFFHARTLLGFSRWPTTIQNPRLKSILSFQACSSCLIFWYSWYAVYRCSTWSSASDSSLAVARSALWVKCARYWKVNHWVHAETIGSPIKSTDGRRAPDEDFSRGRSFLSRSAHANLKRTLNLQDIIGNAPMKVDHFFFPFLIFYEDSGSKKVSDCELRLLQMS